MKDLIRDLRAAKRVERKIDLVRELAEQRSLAAEAIPDLIELAVAADKALRDAATAALIEVDPMWPDAPAAARASQCLVEALVRPKGASKGTAAVRAAAIGLCAQIGEPLVEPLAEALGREPEAGYNVYLLRALGRIGAPAASAQIERIGQAVSSENPVIGEEAIRALAELANDDAVLSYLAAGLGNRWPSVRAQSAKCLGGLGGPAVATAGELARALYDGDEDVRRATSTALRKLGAPVIPALLEFISMRMVTIRTTIEKQLDLIPKPAISRDELESLTGASLQRLVTKFDWHERALQEEYERLEDAYAKALVISAELTGDAGGAQWKPAITELVETAAKSTDKRYVKAAEKARRHLGPPELA